MNDQEFRKLVKDAFEHLYDTAYLGAHPLVPELVRMPDSTRVVRAQKLRSLLKQAIEELRPQNDLPSTAPEWRSYNSLRYRYTQGMSMAQVENTLAISQRQLQREFHKGLDAVTALLAEQRLLTDEPKHNAVLTATNELEALREELNHWQLVREPVQVETLVASVQKMLQPLMGGGEQTLRVELPGALKPVLVDSTLTRQALFQSLRFLFSHEQTAIVLRATLLEHEVKICFDTDVQLDFDASDWQMAQLLVERQGGTLAYDMTNTPRIVLTLPRAKPPRVLVVDDNPAIHELLERYLTPNFYEVVHATNGGEATQTAIESKPDVILLDVMMPAMDGWQVLQELGKNKKTRQIPVIICSVLKEPDLAFSLGARAYLKKPVERLELLETLARLRTADHAAAVP